MREVFSSPVLAILVPVLGPSGPPDGRRQANISLRKELTADLLAYRGSHERT